MLRDFRRLSRRDLRRLGDQPVLISVEGVAGRYLPADSCFEIPFFFTACKAIIPFGMKCLALVAKGRPGRRDIGGDDKGFGDKRSEEQTSEIQSLMRNSYALFCLKKKNK